VQVYAEGKKLIGIFDVEVQYDITRLTNELKRRFAGSHLQASSVNGRIMLSGEVADAVSLDKAVTIARQFGPEIINSVSMMAPQQVMLEVRFIDLGSSITDALRVYSDDLRHQRLSLAEEKAYALPAKLSVPMMVCVFPVLFVVILLPVFVRLHVGHYF
jgi:Flp pilus assembly secretin CpaC